MVNTQSKYYASFVARDTAPRGTLVSRPFRGMFSDPDGDDLSYSAAVTQGRTELVELLLIHPDGQSDSRTAQSTNPITSITRVWFRADADGWKSLTSSLPNPQVVTVTLTATDPGGLSASVSGEFSIEWGLYPEVVSARADGAAIELTFDWAVEANPAPKPWQFTVNVVNEDGSTGTIEVNSVSVDGKVVTLELASALDGSQTVTLDYNGYNYLTGTPLQRAGGGDNAPSFSGQAVENSLKPGRPSNLFAGSGADIDETGFSATLKWAAPTDGNPPSSYQILRREDEANSSLSVLVDDTGDTNTTYRDTAVAKGKTYIYRVKGRNAAGLGEESLPTKVKIEDYRIETGCGYDDCIRPIYNPSFLDADEVGNRMRADEYVIGVSINGDSRAYSVVHLYWKEVVRDTVGGTPIVVTWCPNCLTTIVYDRTVDGEVYDFGASGKLMRIGAPVATGCLVLHDHQTRSLWSQVLGVGVDGEHAGAELKTVPHTLTTWEEWVKLHPDTKVLKKPQTSGNMTINVREPDDSSFQSRWDSQYAAVSVAKIGDQRIGYLFSRLADSGVQNTEFNGANLLLFYDSGSKTALVFDRAVDGKTLSFRRHSGSGADTMLVDTETGSKWKAFTGVATEGELAGSQLEQIHSHPIYWRTWQNYYPDSRVYPKPVIPAQPSNLAVGATAGSLDLSATWDPVENATSYRLRWRQSGGSSRRPTPPPSPMPAQPSPCRNPASGSFGCRAATASAAARRPSKRQRCSRRRASRRTLL